MSTPTRRQLTAILRAQLSDGDDPTGSWVAGRVLAALVRHPDLLRALADEVQPPARCCATEPAIADAVRQVVHDWGARLPASRFVGDTVEAAVVMATVAEVMDLADQVAAAVTPARPRVWQDVTDVPEGTHVLDRYGQIVRPDEDTPEIGPLVEVVLPDYAAEVARAAAGEVQAR